MTKSRWFFNVVSLFTKISVDLAMEIAKKQLEFYPGEDLQETINWLVKEICTKLRICLQAAYLKYRNKFFRQLHGIAMGSPVSVVVANWVIEDAKEKEPLIALSYRRESRSNL